MNANPGYRTRIGRIPVSVLLELGIALLALVGLYAGWRMFKFLTDDAYIDFRYVSNSYLGYGYTWNLPPFRAVEGYTSFLWVVLLDGVWRVAGLQPPDSANKLSFVFAAGTTLLGIAMLHKMKLRPQLEKVRLPLMALVLLGTLTNRTFLIWTSSGLETALFNFTTTAWVYCCLFLVPNTRRWMLLTSVTAVLAGLTRPDGLVFIGATLVLLAASLWDRWRAGLFRWPILLTLAPFFVTVIHFLWRHAKYGAWLPNTLAAKFVQIWPQSGIRYLLSFTIEYTLWFFVGLALLWLGVSLRAWWQSPDRRCLSVAANGKALTPFTLRVAVVGALVAQFSYYTFIIGGDHFEYRIYSGLVLLMLVATVWMLNELGANAWRALAFMSVFIVCTWPIPWTDWALTHNLNTRQQTYHMHVPLAGWFPGPVRPYVREFDDLQSWMASHSVGLRYQEHKVFALSQLAYYPSRSQGLLLAPGTHTVMSAGAVGVLGWVLPTTNIIDWLGLNDAVIAHNPVDPSLPRHMAHERYPPPGYVACFQPNVYLAASNEIVVAQRASDAASLIRGCETRTWAPGRPANYNVSNSENVKIDNGAIAEYLANVPLPATLYMSYVPQTQEPAAENASLLSAFSGYSGSGCLVFMPGQQPGEPPESVLAFLTPIGRPSLSALARLFPWTQMVRPPSVASPLSYVLGYAASIASASLPTPSQPVTANWVNHVSLLGFDLPGDGIYHPGDMVDLNLYYHVDGPVSDNYSFLVSLLAGTTNAAGEQQLIASDKGEPCRGIYPLVNMRPGSMIVSKAMLRLPPDVATGNFALAVDLISSQTGQRALRLDTTPPTAGVDLGSVATTPRP